MQTPNGSSNWLIRKAHGAYRRAVEHLPHVRPIVEKVRYAERFCPLDHFYSPIPSTAELRTREKVIFETKPESLAGIDLNLKEQIETIKRLGEFHDSFPFPQHAEPGWRYFWDNSFFGAADGTYLYAILRHLNPSRIIEIGSGYSSAVMLDTVERFFPTLPELTFIEPYPDRLLSLVNPAKSPATIIEKFVQDVPVSLFDNLSSGDVLFIDSTHVCKTGSDVNHLFFNVLPQLRAGVHVHIHDIFYPFEYPKDWVYGGRSWNEAYLLRALLTHNRRLKIACFGDYLVNAAPDSVRQFLPRTLTAPNQSIWLRTEDPT